MSGGQIGTVIGGAIGAYFGGAVGAQIGMAVGGMVGGAIDPTKVKGPHIGDGQQQTATDGTPIAWVQGHARVAGTIVQVSKRREVKKTDDGKGSGTENITYEARQDFAILICESDSQRNSRMDSVLIIEQDGKIVYDTRPGSTILQDSADFAEGVDFLFGGEDQMPHPVLEAITGVGNTPAYRGVLVAVFKNFNLTVAGDRIPSFVFTLGSGDLGSSSIRYDDSFHYYHLPTVDDSISLASPDYDDSQDVSGKGAFGSPSLQSVQGASVNTPFNKTNIDNAETIWLRKKLYASPGQDFQGKAYGQCDYTLFINGEVVYGPIMNDHGGAGIITVAGAHLNRAINQLAVRATSTSPSSRVLSAGLDFWPQGPQPPRYVATYYLATMVRNVALRGGLTDAQIDTSEIEGITVLGYPIAVQSSPADCIAPLLAAYFAYASEYDGAVHFRLMGADAALTVNSLDLVESDTGTDGGSLIAEDRKQLTEYPRKMTASYYDPDQTYTSVNVSYERNSSDVKAVGEQTFSIPVVMTSDAATKATVKAMKTAYATLEGTREYSLPYVGHDGEPYLTLTAGECVLFQGKRWVIDELTITHNMLHLKTTYNRQSAYTTKVQAIPSNPPVPPISRVGGPTTLYAMNLPSLRPQDSYGLYLAASGNSEAWAGCTVQISYDGGVSWQNGLQVKEASVLGTLTSPITAGGSPLSVEVTGDLFSVTPEQIAARANAAAILSSSDAAEIIQFQTASETSNAHYDLSVLSRGLLGTPQSAHVTGERFTMLDSVYFLPVDLQFGEETLLLRAVTLGGKVEDATVVSIVYRPDDQVILDGGGDPI